MGCNWSWYNIHKIVGKNRIKRIIIKATKARRSEFNSSGYTLESIDTIEAGKACLSTKSSIKLSRSGFSKYEPYYTFDTETGTILTTVNGRIMLNQPAYISDEMINEIGDKLKNKGWI